MPLNEHVTVSIYVCVCVCVQQANAVNRRRALPRPLCCFAFLMSALALLLLFMVPKLPLVLPASPPPSFPSLHALAFAHCTTLVAAAHVAFEPRQGEWSLHLPLDIHNSL